MSNCSVIVNVTTSVNTVDAGFGALGLILGILIGFIISFLIFWICCFYRKFERKHYNPLCLVRIRWPKAEEFCYANCLAPCSRLLKRPNNATVEAQGESRLISRSPSPSPSRRQRPATAKSSAGDQGDADDSADSLVAFCLAAAAVGPAGNDSTTAMIDVITQTTEYGGEQRLSEQDCVATEQLEQELTRQRLVAFAQLCWLLLAGLAKQKQLDEASSERLQRAELQRLRRQHEELEAEQRRRRSAILDDPRLDDEARRRELSRLSTRFGSQLSELLASELDRLGREVGREAKMDERQLDDLLQRHKAAAARLEEKLRQHRLRQSNALEEALARRRLLLAEQAGENEAVEYDMELRLQSRGQQLQRLRTDGGGDDCQRMLSQYRLQLLRHKEAFQRDYQQQQQTLADRLRQLRSKQEAEAEQQYSEAAASLAEAVEAGTMTDPDAFLSEYFDLLEEFSEQRQRRREQLDDKDCNQLALLREDLSQEKRNAEAAAEEALRKQLPAMEEDEWGRLLDQHRAHTDRLRQRRQQQRQQQLRQLEEKVSQRQSQLSDSLAERESELASLEKSQEVVLKKSLAFQLDMDEASKKRILEEHHRSMLALGNSLQVSRLKQEKQLEAKVAGRKALIGQLRRECRDAELAAADERQAERARQELQRQEEEQRRLLQAESREGRRRLRDELAKETEEALSSQESQLGLVIAKLQTGQARRRRIIDKQERILNDLQSQLEAKVSGDASSPTELDQIIHSHRNQVASLSDQMQRERRQQEQLLAERLERRKMEREEEVKEEVDNEERSASKALSATGHGEPGKVARFALELSLDSKFRTSMMQMEAEMQLELKRQQEELDREMEADLQAALEEQRKQLLSQLARVTNISQSEMKQMVARAGEASGADRRLTRQVSTEIADAGRQLQELESDSRKPRKRGSRRFEMDSY